MGMACSLDGEGRGVYRVLVRKHEVKRPLGRPRCRGEDNIKKDLQEVGCGGMDRILILVIYWKKTGLLHTKIGNHNIIYSS
jgi:hypothetical protein